MRPPVICLNAGSWDRAYWVDRHYLMAGLAARGWPVVFSPGAHSLWECHTADWNQVPLLGRFKAVDFGGSNRLMVDQPGKLPPLIPKFPWYDRKVLRYHGKRLLNAFPHGASGNAITFLTAPSFEPYLDALRTRYVVFHIHDAVWKNRSWSAAAEKRLQHVLRRADLIIALAESMVRDLSLDSSKACIIIPQAVNAEEYIAGPDAPCPPDLARIPRPRIGYIGRVSQKVNLELVHEIAKQKPGWNWVFVGALGVGFQRGDSSSDMLEKCKELPNVHMLGARPQNEMPQYMGHMDVNTMCYKQLGGYWEAINPLKLLEYLAVGRPIIGVNIENIRKYADVIDIAETTDEWIAALERALTAGGVGTIQQRQHIALDNTWDKRIDVLEDRLLELVDSPK